MSIIEKLGITPPDEVRIVGDVWKVYDLAGLPQPHVSNDLFFEQGKILKKILDNKNEMLEALIRLELQLEILTGEDDFEIKQVIEKATGKTWEEIKEILQ